jgi:phospholipase C
LSKGLTGRNYGALTSSNLWGLKYSSIIRPISAFYSDASAGTLPNVAFVDPDFSDDFGGSYHPPDDIRKGEAFLASVYKAVTTSPQWKSSLLVITFDEWGGFFDHVVPSVAPLPSGERAAGNTDGLRGFRVPTILVSPFVKRGHVSSTVYDHASVLKLIETRWGLDPLTVRDAQANDMMGELTIANPILTAPAIDVPTGPFAVPCK